MPVAPMPIGQAQRGGKSRRFLRVEQAQQLEMGVGSGRRASVGQFRESWRAIAEPQDEWRRSFNLSPQKLAILIDTWCAIDPDKLQGFRMAMQGDNRRRIRTQWIGAVEPFAREKWIRRQVHPFGLERPRRP